MLPACQENCGDVSCEACTRRRLVVAARHLAEELETARMDLRSARALAHRERARAAQLDRWNDALLAWAVLATMAAVSAAALLIQGM